MNVEFNDQGDQPKKRLSDVEPEDDNIFRGQARIAVRFVEKCADRFRHVHNIGWYVWDGARWASSQRGETTQALLELIRESWAEALSNKELATDVRSAQTAAGVAGVLKIASQMKPIARVAADMDADPFLLNTANGTLDLRTGNLGPHDPSHLITKQTRAAYDPAASTAQWDAVLDRILPDQEVRSFLQRYVGTALVGKVQEHKLVILTGTGRNGKGTFYEAVNYSLGEYAQMAEPELFLHKQGAHPTGQMDLFGARFVVTSETEQGRRMAAATVKRLTGGDPIKARYMGKDFVEFEPSHTAVMVTNYLPEVSGNDPALWARLRVVPFNVRIPDQEQIKGLNDLLQLEADGILQWAYRGWVDYTHKGYNLDEPNAVLAATADYEIDSDYVGQFIEEACEINPDVKTPKAHLFTKWTMWSVTQAHIPELTVRGFVKEMNRRGFANAVGTGGVKCLEGIS